ncbi:MAG: DUF6703 family protein [Micromonosporaceae bacterium]
MNQQQSGPDRRPDADQQSDSRAARLVDRLNRLPRLVVFLVAFGLALAAFFTPGYIGAVLVGLLAAVVLGRLWLTWPLQTPPQRAVQLLTLGVLIVIAGSKVP